MLRKVNSSPQHSDKAQSERAARDYLRFIVANLKHLEKVRNGSKYKEAAISMSKQRDPLTDKQKSYIDIIYEKVMEGYGEESYKNLPRKHTTFGLKFGSR